MKQTLLPALLLLAGSSTMLTSCDLSSAGNTLANAYVNQVATGGGTSVTTAIGTALQDMLKSNSKYGELGTVAIEVLKSLRSQGVTYNYSGTATVEALSGTYEPMAYNSIGKATPTVTTSLTTNAKTFAESNTAALTIDAYNVGSNIAVSQIVIANLGLQHQGGTSSMSLTDYSGFNGTCTCTVNGKAYNAATVYITSATATEKKLDLNLTIYYGENYTNPVNITYSGVVK